MHVAVVGAGALGAVYGVRLALRTPTTVTFVVRPRRVSETTPLTIHRVGRTESETLAAPVRAAVVPHDADVIVLAVGTEDLEALRTPLGDSEAPMVVLTPMMPADWARMRAAFGDRVHAALPTVVSYARNGEIRYWLQGMPTKIDEPRAGEHGVAVRAFARALDEADLPTRFELGVHENNPATTLCFIPLGMALSLAPSMEAFAKDAVLVDLAQRACAEGVALGKRVGRAEPLATLAPWLVQPTLLRVAVAALQRFDPEAVHYAEHHFGAKLKDQHRVMADAIVALAEAKAMPHEALSALAARLARGGASEEIPPAP